MADRVQKFKLVQKEHQVNEQLQSARNRKEMAAALER